MLCVCTRLYASHCVLICLHYFPREEQIELLTEERVFFSPSLIYIRVCMFVLLIHLRDAVWSVYPSREVLFAWACKQTHRCRCFTVSAPRYDSPLFHLPPLASVTLVKITQLCARRREPDDTIAHVQKSTLPFLFFYLPPLPLSNWFSPLYGRPLASAFDPYSTLTSACPYQRRL